MQKSFMTLGTLYLRNCGAIVYLGHAGFLVSTVVVVGMVLRATDDIPHFLGDGLCSAYRGHSARGHLQTT